MKLPYMQDLGNTQVSPLVFSGLNRKDIIEDTEISSGINLDSELIPALSPRKSIEKLDGMFVDALDHELDIINDYTIEVLREDALSYTINNGIHINFPNFKPYSGLLLGTDDNEQYYGGIKLVNKKTVLEFNITANNMWEGSQIKIELLNEETGVVHFTKIIPAGTVGNFRYPLAPKSEKVYLAITIDADYGIGDEALSKPANISFSNIGIKFFNETKKPVSYFTIINNKQIYISEGYLYCDQTQVGQISDGAKSIVDFNGNIVIFPDKKYYDYITGVFGTFTCPYDIEFTTVHYNRIFGIKGSDVYASKVGDFKVWDDYSGNEMNSWAADVYSEGNFTGITSYQDHVVFFKRDRMYELYGYTPSQFKIMEVNKIGCIDNKSISEVGGVLYFMSEKGVQSYAGGFPRDISDKLNLNNVIKAASIGDGRKYYVCINGVVYIYDTWQGTWIPYMNIDVVEFSKSDNDIYALVTDGNIYQLETGNEIVEWEAITKKFDDGTFRKKSIKSIRLKAKMSIGAELSIYVSADERPFVLHKTIKHNELYYKEHREILTTIPLKRASTYQIKIVGKGKSIVYGEREFVVGSDK